MWSRLTPIGKLTIIVGITAVVMFLVWLFGMGGTDVLMPQGKSAASGNPTVAKVDGKKPVRVIVVTWGGYAGAQYFNRGFKPSKESRYMQDYNLPVEFIVIDDFQASRDAWKADQADLLWITADAFPTEVDALRVYDPKIVLQADWSRGGDVIIATRNIRSVGDLRGKRVAVAFGTPSHSFLLWLLKANDMSVRDIIVVEAPSAIDAAGYFKAGKVDAAVVWSPDDEDCLANVAGSHKLSSSKDAAYIIADVFYAKGSWIATHQAELKALVEGWMRGAAEINSNPTAKEEAIRILAAGYNQPEDFMRNAINNVRLCTFGDNANFFNLKGNYQGVTGEDLYVKTGAMYQEIGLAPTSLPSWRTVTDLSALRSLNLYGPDDAAEPMPRFTKASHEAETIPALATKRLSVSFATGSSILDENAKTIIDLGFGDLGQTFNYRVRVAGNTDSTGSYQGNVSLSYKRAEAVVNYLVQQYRFDPNRFVVIGNGPDRPVATNATEEGRARNRRTDFEFIPN